MTVSVFVIPVSTVALGAGMSPDDIPLDHQTGEATPQDVPAPAVTAGDFGLHDASWDADEWKKLLESLVASGMATWQDVTALFLGHLNPSQVGTNIASSEGFKRKYGKGKTMGRALKWMYRQPGRCATCKTRLELQVEGGDRPKLPPLFGSLRRRIFTKRKRATQD